VNCNRALWIGTLAVLFLGVRATVSGAGSLPAGEPETTSPPENTARATFAGGCFWCMQGPFDELEGVLETTSGYTGGHVENPSYEQVSAGGTGHTEAVQVTYDPGRVSYDELLEVFWRNIDPTDATGQFCDRGSQYRSGIYWHDDEQQRLAETSRAELSEQARFDAPVATEILEAQAFHTAEDYHQNYYKRNPIRYRFYRSRCGRDRRLREVWGDETSGKRDASH